MQGIATKVTYMCSSLFLLLLQYIPAFAQVADPAVEEYPLNLSPYRVVFYIVISFIVIAVVFWLMYKPRKKHNK
nr:hypothetical protein [Cytophagales bacterium]